MQAFDTSSENRALSAPKLTAQSLQYGRDEMPFLAFGGTEKPRDYNSEYQTAEHYDVNNTFGNLGKGGFKDKYGLIWDGERQIYDRNNKEAKNQMFNMTNKARENQNGAGGAIITKEGRTECTPGYIMVNGDCVMETTTSICQPGWRKEDGVCVKAPQEFMDGKTVSGSMGTASAATAYPMTKTNVLSLKRLRQYVEEKESGEPEIPWWGWVLIVLLFLFLVVVATALGVPIFTGI